MCVVGMGWVGICEGSECGVGEMCGVGVSWVGVGDVLASFPGSCVGEEEREPDTHCSRMRQVPLVTCILLHYTKITVNLLKGRTAWLYPLGCDAYGLAQQIHPLVTHKITDLVSSEITDIGEVQGSLLVDY